MMLPILPELRGFPSTFSLAFRLLQLLPLDSRKATMNGLPEEVDTFPAVCRWVLPCVDCQLRSPSSNPVGYVQAHFFRCRP